jgi:hypothetical protein
MVVAAAPSFITVGQTQWLKEIGLSKIALDVYMPVEDASHFAGSKYILKQLFSSYGLQLYNDLNQHKELIPEEDVALALYNPDLEGLCVNCFEFQNAALKRNEREFFLKLKVESFVKWYFEDYFRMIT